MTDEFDQPVRAPIPEKSMINGEIVVTSYFDSDGQLKYATNLQGAINLAQALGLLELAKFSIRETYMQNEPYSSDDDEGDDEDGRWGD